MLYRNNNDGERERMLSTLTADAYWQKLVDAGWLEPLTPEQTRNLKADVLREFEINPVTAWQALAVLSFDSETIYEAETEGLSYAAIVRDLSEASGGRFSPTHIACHLEDGNWHLRFFVDSKPYLFSTNAATDYFNTDLLSVINQALKDAGSPYRFSTLPANDQIIHIAFARPETISVSVRQLLIPALK